MQIFSTNLLLCPFSTTFNCFTANDLMSIQMGTTAGVINTALKIHPRNTFTSIFMRLVPVTGSVGFLNALDYSRSYNEIFGKV